MFNNLSEKLSNIFNNIDQKTFVSEKDLEDGIKAINIALIEADVNVNVIQYIINEIRNSNLKEEFTKGIGVGKQFINLVSQKICLVLGQNKKHMKLENKIHKLMLVGLQGSGKTTSAAKIAYFLQNQKHRKCLVIAGDVKRYAAVEQLQILGKENGFKVFSQADSTPIEIIKNALDYAQKNNFTSIILDTAGRIQINEVLMSELQEMKRLFDPHDVLFVADSMSGQQIVEVAKNFNNKIDLTGIFLSKTDGDARGGGALSIVYETKVPIIFSGNGEKITNLEKFNPSSIADRILGLSDVVSLVEDLKKVIDEKAANKINQKMLNGKFNLVDLLMQLKMVKKIGTSKLMNLLPNSPKINPNQQEQINKEIKEIETLIYSMTKKERTNPKLLKISSRKTRIIKGSGLNAQAYNKLLRKYEQMKQMAKMMKQGNFLSKRKF